MKISNPSNLSYTKNMDKICLGLSRIKLLMKALNNPECNFASVHIGGTNGKGTVSRLISEILKVSGYKTGLYTSPHLLDVRERIQINSKLIRRKELSGIKSKILKTAGNKGIKLTYFEILTAVAFFYFYKNKIDIAAIEVGLGGRLDATNVLAMPEVSVITNISMEHTDWLGNKITDIAYEKAGILKSNTPIITGTTDKPALRKIINTAKQLGSPIKIIHKDFTGTLNKINWNKKAQSISYKSKTLKIDGIQTKLLGKHNLDNIILAIAICEELIFKGWKITAESIKTGIKNTCPMGRFEILRSKKTDKTVIIDTAHNPAGVKTTVNTLSSNKHFKNKVDVIFGCLRDKDARNMLKTLSGISNKVFITPVRSSRSQNPELLAKIWRSYTDNIEIYKNFKAAWQNIDDFKRPVLVTGSFYLAAEAIKTLKAAGNGYFKRNLS